jgi:hypothetical protein
LFTNTSETAKYQGLSVFERKGKPRETLGRKTKGATSTRYASQLPKNSRNDNLLVFGVVIKQIAEGWKIG